MLGLFLDRRGWNPRRRDTWSLGARRRKKNQHEKKTPERRDTPVSLLPHTLDSSFPRRIRQTSLRRGYGLAGQPSAGNGVKECWSNEVMQENSRVTLLPHSTTPIVRYSITLIVAPTTSCSGDASYDDFASCACGACAWQF